MKLLLTRWSLHFISLWYTHRNNFFDIVVETKRKLKLEGILSGDEVKRPIYAHCFKIKNLSSNLFLVSNFYAKLFKELGYFTQWYAHLYQRKSNISFLENVSYVLNERSPVNVYPIKSTLAVIQKSILWKS